MSVSKVKALFTRAVANAGIKIPLLLPTGDDSGEYLLVCHVLCDAYRDAEQRFESARLMLTSRAASAVAVQGSDKAEQARALERDTSARLSELHMQMRACLVTEWSDGLKEVLGPCTQANVEKLLREAPQVSDLVMNTATADMLFFGAAAASSQHGQQLNSSSDASLHRDPESPSVSQ